MKILLINHYAGSEKHGMEYRPFYMSKEWVKQGHEVMIVASTFSHLRLNNPVHPDELKEEVISGIRYTWLKGIKYQGNGAKRILNMLQFLYKLYKHKRFFLDFKPDAIICSSTYPLDIFPAKKLADYIGAKLIYEVHDLWPLTPMLLGGFSKNHPYIKLLQFGENFSYEKSHKIISMLSNAKGHMLSHGMEESKYCNVPNGIYPETWNEDIELPSMVSTVLKKAREQNSLIVGYTGSHGVANALESFIDTARILKDKNIYFILVGDGPLKAELMNAAKGLDNISFIDKIEKKYIPPFLTKCDVLFLGFRANELYDHGACPNKMLDYLMAARPMLLGMNGEHNIINETSCFVKVPAEQAEEIAKGIMQLAQKPQEELNAMGKAGKEYVMKNHSYENLSKKFIQHLQNNKERI
ncbi:MAG: glycosyltransferase WbuB [Denitrovibrio sp.]|nr:MAG: glycosyltransferase WbuB [Denitrovibrio sp.]